MAGLTLPVLVLLAAAGGVAPRKVVNKPLWCGSCQGLLDEIEYRIAQINPKRTIDVGGNHMAKTKVLYARSETFLTEVLEEVCAEMQNYSEFVVEGRKFYKRYQNRPGETKPLKLKNFGWSLEVQGQMRNACEIIAEEKEEGVVEYYRLSRELERPARYEFCQDYCSQEELDQLDLEKGTEAETEGGAGRRRRRRGRRRRSAEKTEL